MKKLLMVIAIVAMTGLHQMFSQDIQFGAKAGANFSTFTGDNEHADTRTAFHFGVMAEIEISEKFSVQPELLYSAQGAEYSDVGFSEFTYDGTFKNDYLNLPIMGKYYVAEGFSLEAGPQVGFLLSAKEEWEETNTGDSGEDDLKDSFKGIDFGLNFGLGYKMENGINFAARYCLGLSDLNDDDDYFGDDTYKNGVIQVSVGYFF